jgi:cell division protein FtsB
MDTFSTFGESRRRKRQGVLGRLVRLALVIGLLGAAVAYAYQVGVSQKESEVVRLGAEIEELREANQRLSSRAAQALQQAEQARAARARLAAEVVPEASDGVPRELTERLEARLREGVPAERLAFVIDSVTRERECDAEPVTRRFMVRTPIGGQQSSVVGFAGNRITVTGEGVPARNAQGQPEAWFDQAEPVELRFTKLGGEVETASGVLPVTHSVVVEDREWRFQIVPAEQRGFVQITGQSCAWP